MREEDKLSILELLKKEQEKSSEVEKASVNKELETLVGVDYKNMKPDILYCDGNTWYLWTGFVLAKRDLCDLEWHIMTQEEVYALRLKTLICTNNPIKRYGDAS